jgi:sporulation protein YlmC with PRC-barrel domain
MAEARIIEDVQNLQGEKVYDSNGRGLGQIQHVYGLGEDNTPMWITLEASEGIGSKRVVFVPVARVKQESDRLQVPYSTKHLQESPEVEIADEISEEDDRALRDFYTVDLADNEQRTDNVSYAAQVPEGDGLAKRLDSE